MKLMKDVQRNPSSLKTKRQVIARAVELGATHVALTTPYNDATGTKVVQDTQEWVHLIRQAGLAVSHRHMFMEFEGIYDTAKDTSNPKNFIDKTEAWIKQNADLIQAGDSFTLTPEPQNAGVVGLNCGSNCMFPSVEAFNQFLQQGAERIEQAFVDLGIENVELICCGFDAFVVSGNNNPDWQGKSFLSPTTIESLETIAIDHYPQPDYRTGIRRSYGQDLHQITGVHPEVPLYLTEFGFPGLDNPQELPRVFGELEPYVQSGLLRGVFWWPFGDHLPEGLLNDDQELTPNQYFYMVQQGFQQLRRLSPYTSTRCSV